MSVEGSNYIHGDAIVWEASRQTMKPEGGGSRVGAHGYSLIIAVSHEESCKMTSFHQLSVIVSSVISGGARDFLLLVLWGCSTLQRRCSENRGFHVGHIGTPQAHVNTRAYTRTRAVPVPLNIKLHTTMPRTCPVHKQQQQTTARNREQ